MVGVIEYECVKEKLNEKPSKKQYGKYTPEIRYEIGKYAASHGPSAAVKKKFKTTYPELSESTVRGFRTKYHEILKQSQSNVLSSKKIVSLKRGRPLLWGNLDEKITNFLFAIRKKGGEVPKEKPSCSFTMKL